MNEVTPDLVKAASQIRLESGKFTPKHIGVLAFRFDLPVKTTCEFLEYAECLPTGTWDRLADRGATSKLIKKSACE